MLLDAIEVNQRQAFEPVAGKIRFLDGETAHFNGSIIGKVSRRDIGSSPTPKDDQFHRLISGTVRHLHPQDGEEDVDLSSYEVIPSNAWNLLSGKSLRQLRL